MSIPKHYNPQLQLNKTTRKSNKVTLMPAYIQRNPIKFICKSVTDNGQTVRVNQCSSTSCSMGFGTVEIYTLYPDTDCFGYNVLNVS